jgi:hypothetical protein
MQMTKMSAAKGLKFKGRNTGARTGTEKTIVGNRNWNLGKMARFRITDSRLYKTTIGQYESDK